MYTSMILLVYIVASVSLERAAVGTELYSKSCLEASKNPAVSFHLCYNKFSGFCQSTLKKSVTQV